ncbi:MAG: carboxypeptidase regulatory-like domain-containing protein [Candidatus Xenobiia bacterium LiM19]
MKIASMIRVNLLVSMMLLLCVLTGCGGNGGDTGTAYWGGSNDNGGSATQTYSVSGTLRDATSGAAVQYATCTLMSGIREGFLPDFMQQMKEPITVSSTTTDENGQYRFTGVAAGTYTIQFAKSDYVTTEVNDITVSGDVTNPDKTVLQISQWSQMAGAGHPYDPQKCYVTVKADIPSKVMRLTGVTGSITPSDGIQIGYLTDSNPATIDWNATSTYSNGQIFYYNLTPGVTYTITMTAPGYTFNPLTFNFTSGGINGNYSMLATSPTPTPYPSPSPTSSPTPTPSPTVSPSPSPSPGGGGGGGGGGGTPSYSYFFGGDLGTYNEPMCLKQLNSDGTPDATFNPGGTGANNTVTDITLQGDGKILIGGIFTSYNGTACNYFTRLNSDGTIDNTFNPGGSGPNGVISNITLQGDGKILIGGAFWSYNGTVCGGNITRLNNDGTLDTTFNSGAGANGPVESIAVQGDGKIIIAGNFTSFNGTSCGYITRLESNGTIDVTFNPLGLAGANNVIQRVVLQGNGKILVSGSFTSFNGTACGYITRLESNGILDATFNPGGAGANHLVVSVSLQGDGKIVICGLFTSYNDTACSQGVIRLESDGTLDPTFNNGGSGVDFVIENTIVQTDGKIIVGGAFNSYNGTACSRDMIRLKSDGTIDAAFNPGGVGASNNVESIAIQADGKIIIGGGFTSYNGSISFTKLSNDGTLDSAFNPGGTGANNTVEDITLQSNGKILIGGWFTSYNGTACSQAITRLNSDGTIDAAFNPGGAGANGPVDSIAIQGDGKILIGGWFTSYNGTACSYDIIRLNNDGTPDVTFNPGGAGANNAVWNVAVQSDGKILICGWLTSYNGTACSYISRLNNDGTLDATFNPGGAGANNLVESVSVQGDGKILICGLFTSYNGTACSYITRLNSDGTLDATFNVGGAGSNGPVDSIAIQGDGKILVGGSLGSYNGTACSQGIIRLKSDGTIDATFNPGGAGAASGIFSITVQGDGKILIGIGSGQPISYNGTACGHITRLNSDGTLDATFYPGGSGASSTVRCIAVKQQ